MRLALLCDLHLPYHKDAAQYDALRFYLHTLEERKPDALLYVGDITASGDLSAADIFVAGIHRLGVPAFVIPGNSDLRDAATAVKMRTYASPTVNRIGDITVFAVNDCDGNVSDETLAALNDASAKDIVMLHHPYMSLHEPSRTRFAAWRASHPDTVVFYAHLHKSLHSGNDIALQAADPDKAIGECPCMSFYDTQTGALTKKYYECPVPSDFADHVGFSVFSPLDDLAYAAEKRVKYLELRPNAAEEDADALDKALANWRSRVMGQLSVHLTDVSYSTEEGFGGGERLQKTVALAVRAGASRVTLHVPKMSVGDARTMLDETAAYAAGFLSALPEDCVVGVENMHMTSRDRPDDTRRFGYIPSELLAWREALERKLSRYVGVNLDIGHARNNAPYSERYNLSSWYAEVGAHCVGYHIHQVLKTEEGFENHTPITEYYGKLISLASFFRGFSGGQLQKAPLIFEVRGKDAYKISLDLFRKS